LQDELPDKDIPPKLLTRVPTNNTTCGEVWPSLSISSARKAVARSDQSTTSKRMLLGVCIVTVLLVLSPCLSFVCVVPVFEMAVMTPITSINYALLSIRA